jgi:hypothetical protein
LPAIDGERNTNTLVLVHRQQLLDHRWRGRAFLDIEADRVGVIRKEAADGFHRCCDRQSLVRREGCRRRGRYGQLVVDECHHLSAVSFEAVARAVKAKYARPVRNRNKEGWPSSIIFMQCGPIVTASMQKRPPRPFTGWWPKTAFRAERQARSPGDGSPTAFGRDTARNDMIFDDILSARSRSIPGRDHRAQGPPQAIAAAHQVART